MQKNKQEKNYISVAELAKKLGVSRVAIFKKIKKGQIAADKIGRSYAISMDYINDFIVPNKEKSITAEKKTKIDQAVHKIVQEYGETLKLLGKE